jgi:hypothetical protein
MKSLWIVAVLVCVVLTSGVWAQSMVNVSPRAAGMGGAAIGVADDASAWYQNPAGLGALNLSCKPGSEYASDAMAAWASNNDDSAWGVTWSGWKPKDKMGFGAGYGWLHDTGSAYGAGFGASFKSFPLSLGANVMGINPDGPDEDQTIINLGAMYLCNQGQGKAPIRLGLTVGDVTNQYDDGAVWSAGIAWPATPELLVALDVVDIGTAWNNNALFSGGVEYACGKAKEWRARAGFMGTEDEDGDTSTRLTLGAGYAAKDWRVDVAWVNTDPDSTWSIGLGTHF